MIERFAHYPSLADRIVFVTGGASGIGASVVEHFCAQRANVVFVDIDEAAASALCARIGRTGSRPPRFIRCDLRDVAALQAIIRRIGEDTGPITVLVNNAANDDRHRRSRSRRPTGTSASRSTCATSSSPRRPSIRR